LLKIPIFRTLVIVVFGLIKHTVVVVVGRRDRLAVVLVAEAPESRVSINRDRQGEETDTLDARPDHPLSSKQALHVSRAGHNFTFGNSIIRFGNFGLEFAVSILTHGAVNSPVSFMSQPIPLGRHEVRRGTRAVVVRGTQAPIGFIAFSLFFLLASPTTGSAVFSVLSVFLLARLVEMVARHYRVHLLHNQSPVPADGRGQKTRGFLQSCT
jgi:hypothetical protein